MQAEDKNALATISRMVAGDEQPRANSATAAATNEWMLPRGPGVGASIDESEPSDSQDSEGPSSAPETTAIEGAEDCHLYGM